MTRIRDFQKVYNVKKAAKVPVKAPDLVKVAGPVKDVVKKEKPKKKGK